LKGKKIVYSKCPKHIVKPVLCDLPRENLNKVTHDSRLQNTDLINIKHNEGKLKLRSYKAK
jgi:hypothetical protein